ncbi:MAG: hypothetical protein A6F71_06810 [Cycloclasticus sp. symbiont of Poecilosclerida sp. M]|nr:MAG: hypothetical protein A6F71_06810 [Cycloclasticus sp. symbiont of Poecilosclerida sp. M]
MIYWFQPNPPQLLQGLAWSAFGAAYFGFDIADIFTDVLIAKLKSIDWLRSVTAPIFIIGGFLVICIFVSATYRNRQQITHLKSLDRALTLTLYLLIEKIKLLYKARAVCVFLLKLLRAPFA